VQLSPRLARAFCDPSERCRERAAALLGAAAAAAPDPAPLLAAALPALAARAGGAEEVEEVRLARARALAAAASAPRCTPALAAHLPLLLPPLVEALKDPFADLARAACAACAALSAALPPGALGGPAASELLTAAAAAAAHRHAAVRSAALEALEALAYAALTGGEGCEAEALLPPPLRALGCDRAPPLRAAARAACARLLLRAGGARQGLAAQTLPLLLLGLSEDGAGAGEEALRLLDALGASWSPSRARDADAAPDAAPDWMPPTLPRPPSPAARELVASFLPLLLPPTLAELRGWAAAPRAAAARLLLSLLLCCLPPSPGGACAPLEDALGRLIPALAGAIADAAAAGEAGEAAGASLLRCARALGSLAPPSLTLPLALHALRSGSGSASENGPGAMSAALAMLAAMLRSPPPQPLAAPEAAALAAALADSRLLEACAEHGGQLLAMAAACGRAAAVAAAGLEAPARAALRPPLFGALLALEAQQWQAGLTGGCAAAGLEALQADGGELYHAHCGALLAALTAEAEAFARTPPAQGGPACTPSRLPGALRALDALLRLAPTSALAPHCAQLGQLWGACCGAEAPPHAARDALMQLDAFLEARGAEAAACLMPAAPAILARALLPQLAWRAGKPAASARYTALVSLCTLLRSGCAPPAAGPPLLPLLTACLEDEQFAEMRRAAAHAMHILVGAGALDKAQLRQLAAAGARRLDDPLAAMRVCGAELAEACARAEARLAPCNNQPLPSLDPVLRALLLHCDDEDAAVRAAAGRAAAALSGCGLLPAPAAAEAAAAARAAARHKDEFAAVIEAANGAHGPSSPPRPRGRRAGGGLG